MVDKDNLNKLTEEEFNQLTESDVTKLLKGLFLYKQHNRTQTKIGFYIEHVTFSDALGVVVLESGDSQSVLLEKEELYVLMHNSAIVNTTLDGNAIYLLSSKTFTIGVFGDTFDKIQTRFLELVMWCDKNVMHNLPPSKQETLEWYLSDLEQLLKIEKYE